MTTKPEFNRGEATFKISTGQRKLKALFWETVGADKSGVVYTLKMEPHEGYPSLYQAYMACDDPTEYTFATQYLDSWDHWEMLTACTWFKPYITKWRRELEIRGKARALLAIKAKAANPDDKESFQANKFWLSYSEPKRKGAGRPSKEEITAEAKRMAEEHTSLNDDLARVTGAIN